MVWNTQKQDFVGRKPEQDKKPRRQFLGLSYATSDENLTEAMRRITEALAKLK